MLSLKQVKKLESQNYWENDGKEWFLWKTVNISRFIFQINMANLQCVNFEIASIMHFKET